MLIKSNAVLLKWLVAFQISRFWLFTKCDYILMIFCSHCKFETQIWFFVSHNFYKLQAKAARRSRSNRTENGQHFQPKKGGQRRLVVESSFFCFPVKVGTNWRKFKGFESLILTNTRFYPQIFCSFVVGRGGRDILRVSRFFSSSLVCCIYCLTRVKNTHV